MKIRPTLEKGDLCKISKRHMYYKKDHGSTLFVVTETHGASSEGRQQISLKVLRSRLWVTNTKIKIPRRNLWKCSPKKDKSFAPITRRMIEDRAGDYLPDPSSIVQTVLDNLERQTTHGEINEKKESRVCSSV